MATSTMLEAFSSDMPCAFFSTDGGKHAPRECPLPRPSPIVYSDQEAAVIHYIKTLRAKWPFICNSIFAPWHIHWFFDEYDFVTKGPQFLYTVLTKITKENEEWVAQMSRQWSDTHEHRFYMFPGIVTGQIGVSDAFHENDLKKHGWFFLEQVLKYVSNAYIAAYEAECSMRQDVIQRSSSSDRSTEFSGAIRGPSMNRGPGGFNMPPPSGPYLHQRGGINGGGNGAHQVRRKNSYQQLSIVTHIPGVSEIQTRVGTANLPHVGNNYVRPTGYRPVTNASTMYMPHDGPQPIYGTPRLGHAQLMSSPHGIPMTPFGPPRAFQYVPAEYGRIVQPGQQSWAPLDPRPNGRRALWEDPDQPHPPRHSQGSMRGRRHSGARGGRGGYHVARRSSLSQGDRTEWNRTAEEKRRSSDNSREVPWLHENARIASQGHLPSRMPTVNSKMPATISHMPTAIDEEMASQIPEYKENVVSTTDDVYVTEAITSDPRDVQDVPQVKPADVKATTGQPITNSALKEETRGIFHAVTKSETTGITNSEVIQEAKNKFDDKNRQIGPLFIGEAVNNMMTLWIGLPPRAGESDIHHSIGSIAKVESIRLQPPKTGNGRACAFVTFFSTADARKVLALESNIHQRHRMVVRVPWNVQTHDEDGYLRENTNQHWTQKSKHGRDLPAHNRDPPQDMTFEEFRARGVSQASRQVDKPREKTTSRYSKQDARSSSVSKLTGTPSEKVIEPEVSVKPQAKSSDHPEAKTWANIASTKVTAIAKQTLESPATDEQYPVPTTRPSSELGIRAEEQSLVNDVPRSASVNETRVTPKSARKGKEQKGPPSKPGAPTVALPAESLSLTDIQNLEQVQDELPQKTETATADEEVKLTSSGHLNEVAVIGIECIPAPANEKEAINIDTIHATSAAEAPTNSGTGLQDTVPELVEKPRQLVPGSSEKVLHTSGRKSSPNLRSYSGAVGPADQGQVTVQSVTVSEPRADLPGNAWKTSPSSRGRKKPDSGKKSKKVANVVTDEAVHLEDKPLVSAVKTRLNQDEPSGWTARALPKPPNLVVTSADDPTPVEQASSSEAQATVDDPFVSAPEEGPKVYVARPLAPIPKQQMTSTASKAALTSLELKDWEKDYNSAMENVAEGSELEKVERNKEAESLRVALINAEDAIFKNTQRSGDGKKSMNKKQRTKENDLIKQYEDRMWELYIFEAKVKNEEELRQKDIEKGNRKVELDNMKAQSSIRKIAMSNMMIEMAEPMTAEPETQKNAYPKFHQDSAITHTLPNTWRSARSSSAYVDRNLNQSRAPSYRSTWNENDDNIMPSIDQVLEDGQEVEMPPRFDGEGHQGRGRKYRVANFGENSMVFAYENDPRDFDELVDSARASSNTDDGMSSPRSGGSSAMGNFERKTSPEYTPRDRPPPTISDWFGGGLGSTMSATQGLGLSDIEGMQDSPTLQSLSPSPLPHPSSPPVRDASSSPNNPDVALQGSTIRSMSPPAPRSYASAAAPAATLLATATKAATTNLNSLGAEEAERAKPSVSPHPGKDTSRTTTAAPTPHGSRQSSSVRGADGNGNGSGSGSGSGSSNGGKKKGGAADGKKKAGAADGKTEKGDDWQPGPEGAWGKYGFVSKGE